MKRIILTDVNVSDATVRLLPGDIYEELTLGERDSLWRDSSGTIIELEEIVEIVTDWAND